MIELIAELGSNHRQTLEHALGLIHSAGVAGAHVVKFQLWGRGEMWRDGDPRAPAVNDLALSEAWLPILKAEVEKHSMEFMVTPFSVRAVGVLEKIGVARYKVASGDITYIPMLREIGKTGKPTFLSVGASTRQEIEVAIAVLRSYRRDLPITLMHCVPEYPCLPEQAELPRILKLIEWFCMKDASTNVGLSAHWKEWWVSVAAVPYGLAAIEHHFGAEDDVEGQHSLTPEAFEDMALAVRDVQAALKSPAATHDYARQNYRRDPSDWLRPMKAKANDPS